MKRYKKEYCDFLEYLKAHKDSFDLTTEALNRIEKTEESDIVMLSLGVVMKITDFLENNLLFTDPDIDDNSVFLLHGKEIKECRKLLLSIHDSIKEFYGFTAK